MRLVIDSNILVSAYTANGKTREYWNIDLGLHELFISPEIFSEVEKTLRHPQFKLSPAEVRCILHDIIGRCILIRPTHTYCGEIADETDRHLVSLAIEADAELILTGEHALQRMEQVEGRRILSFAHFLKEQNLL